MQSGMRGTKKRFGIRGQALYESRPLPLNHQVLTLELAREVEFQMLEILLRHGEPVGDVTKKSTYQIVTAVSDGAIAANKIINELSKNIDF